MDYVWAGARCATHYRTGKFREFGDRILFSGFEIKKNLYGWQEKMFGGPIGDYERGGPADAPLFSASLIALEQRKKLNSNYPK